MLALLSQTTLTCDALGECWAKLLSPFISLLHSFRGRIVPVARGPSRKPGTANRKRKPGTANRKPQADLKAPIGEPAAATKACARTRARAHSRRSRFTCGPMALACFSHIASLLGARDRTSSAAANGATN